MFTKDFWAKRSLRISDKKRNKPELTLRESLFPIALVTILFFLWGFSYSLLDTLNKHFQDTLGINKARSSGLQAAYFGAYPLASLGHAAWLLRHYGYRAVFIWGLFLYGLGALLAIAAIKAHSFGGFCTCIFVIGNGLGSLETAANPYITVCGPPKYAEIRINISQAFNGIGTIISPIVAAHAFLGLTDKSALANVQWVYLAIAAFVFLLAVAFYLAEIPEITDADMAYQAEETHIEGQELPFRKQYRLFHAAFAQFCYCGAQVAIAGFFINYVVDTRPGTDSALASNFLAGAQGAFTAGRFAGTALMYVVRPRWIFLFFQTAVIIFVAPTITQRGNIGMSMLFVVLFFESICFPTIVALGMKGLGRHTKRGSGFIVGGVIGGACVPPLLGVAADAYGTGTAMFVPLIFFLGSLSYALCVNFWPWYRDLVDTVNEASIGTSGQSSKDVEANVVMEKTVEISEEERQNDGTRL
ncbi:major facilitator superfamily domain-containing protein [Dactylonectria macrodidyma]|uniref:Major facilitator superfamily domain-containing protein n=1 Tax=Dactylonectria macrodidyma TaxID=307937 RepID=A0A9P9EHJ9_9HYPO|nr:major facilitator superfamily domain-containing protein [Dactylonectria macrodidyma]